jgi:hypothetical protein
MKDFKLLKALAIVFVFTLLLTFVERPVEAQTNEPIIYEEDGIYEGIEVDSINVDDVYNAIALIQYSDLLYNYVMMTSEDGIVWQYLSDVSEKSEIIPEELALRRLNDFYIASLSHRNGQVRYISRDSVKWESQILYYQDIVYQEGKYWAIDLKGAVYSSDDMVSWQPFVTLGSSSVAELLAINVAVNSESVVISHYSPKWGSTNYLNGLETYVLEGKVWLPSIGYNGSVGTTLDIINTESGFILAYQNDYTYEEPVLFYRSVDGVNWNLETNQPSIIRDLNPLVEEDSNIKIVLDVLNRQINEDGMAGRQIPVQVILNDEVVEFDQDALLVSGSVYVPVRRIFEVLGGTVEYDHETQTVTGVINDTTISLELGEYQAFVNGQTITLDAPAQIINDRALVPARFIAECVGKEVVWDQDNYIVHLK